MSLPRFTSRQIDAFVMVAEQRSFKEAGVRLNLTASAVSQLINELENTVGFKLFNRTTRSVVISSAGTEFLGPARSILKQFSIADSAAADVREQKAGIVRVAAPLAIACSALPAAIAAYKLQRPNVAIKIYDATVENLVNAITDIEADLALGPDRPISDDILRRPIFDSPWVLWCSPKHPFAQKPTLCWSELRNVPLVAAGRDHERSVGQMRAGLPEKERIVPIDVVENISTALGIASHGLAATLAPAYVGALAKPLGLEMRRVVDKEVIRQVCLYSAASKSMSPAAEGFMAFLEEWLPQWNLENSPVVNSL